jgi:serpin B
VLLVLAGCASEVPPPGDLLKSSKARITQAAPEADVTQGMDDAVRFGFDVFRKLPADENLAFSPWSVVTALSMTYPGARGTTQAAFEQTMHLSLPADRYHRVMNTVDAALESRGQGAAGRDGKPFRLRSNNQLFTQKGMPVLPGFLDVLAEEYGAGVRQLDFVTQPEPSRKKINDWVSTNTEGLIPELLAPGTISSDTRLALVNTLYFNAAWKNPFAKEKTGPGNFTLPDGSTARVEMMAGEDLELSYGKLDDVEVFALPYQGDEVSMVLLMPAAGKLAALEAQLDGARLRALLAAATPRTAAVRMPKFEASTQADLSDILKALGLGVAFSGDADFSGMTSEGGLAITSVVHQAVVKTDEAGTEAAAATAVVVGRTSLPEYLEVNRPFVFVIRDTATGAVLFMGRLSHPATLGN